MGGTNPPHTNAAASRRGPGPATQAGFGEGGAGQGGLEGTRGVTREKKQEET